MNLFPVFQNIDNKNILVVGGGNIAKAKISRLLQFTSRITVIAEASDIDYVPVRIKSFSEEDLDGMDLVVLAMGKPEKEIEIAKKRFGKILYKITEKVIYHMI